LKVFSPSFQSPTLKKLRKNIGPIVYDKSTILSNISASPHNGSYVAYRVSGTSQQCYALIQRLRRKISGPFDFFNDRMCKKPWRSAQAIGQKLGMMNAGKIAHRVHLPNAGCPRQAGMNILQSLPRNGTGDCATINVEIALRHDDVLLI
jgi:hypothetical protein